MEETAVNIHFICYHQTEWAWSIFFFSFEMICTLIIDCCPVRTICWFADWTYTFCDKKMERIKHLMKCIVFLRCNSFFSYGSFRKTHASAFKSFFCRTSYMYIVHARICVAAVTGQRAVITTQMEQLKIISILIWKQTERRKRNTNLFVYTQ